MNESIIIKQEVKPKIVMEKTVLITKDDEKTGGGNIEAEVDAILSIGTRREIEGGQINIGSFCTILALDPTASQRVLKRSYRKVISRYHPDILRNTGVSVEEAHELAWRLTQLKEKLGI